MGFGPSISPDVTHDLAPHNPAPLAARFFAGIRWNTVASVATQGSTYGVGLLLARLLGREAFGEYAIILNTIVTAAIVAQVGTSATATKHIAEFRTSQKERAGRILGLCLLMAGTVTGLLALVLVGTSRQVASVLFHAPQLSTSIVIAAGMLVFVALSGTRSSALAGLEDYRGIAFAGIAGALASVVFSAAGAKWLGLNGTLFGLTVASAIQWLILRTRLRRELERQSIAVSYSHLDTERSIIVRFALPAAFSGLFSMPALWFANTLLVRQHDGFSAMAIYSAAATTKVLMLFVPNIINGVGTSLLNNQKGSGTRSSQDRIFWTNFCLVVGSAAVGAAIIASIAVPLLAFFGKSFVIGASVLHILIFAGLVEATMSAVYQLIQAAGNMIFSVLFITIPRDLAILGASAVLIPQLGARGLALAYLFGWVIALVATVAGAITFRRRASEVDDLNDRGSE